VWTNFIDNAVDAMAGTGTLRRRRRPRMTMSSSRSATPARGCHRRWPPVHSRPLHHQGRGQRHRSRTRHRPMHHRRTRRRHGHHQLPAR
jgi:hypothetical protein